MLTANLGPAAQGMVDRLGVDLNVIDVGWPATSSIAWASVVAAFIIPLGLVVNVVMLLTKTTKTMNVDIWNFWHYTFMAALVYTISGSIIQGLIAAVLFQIVCLKVADWTHQWLVISMKCRAFPLQRVVRFHTHRLSFLVKGLQKVPGLKQVKCRSRFNSKTFWYLW